MRLEASCGRSESGKHGGYSRAKLRQPSPAAHPSGAGHLRGGPRWTAAGEEATRGFDAADFDRAVGATFLLWLEITPLNEDFFNSFCTEGLVDLSKNFARHLLISSKVANFTVNFDHVDVPADL